MLCEYGCGLEAKFQLKSGKWCCSKHYSSCLAVKRKNSKTRKQQIIKQKENGTYVNNFHNKNKEPWNKGLTKETDKRIEKGLKTLKEHYQQGLIIPSRLGKHLSKETKLKLSKCGGYKLGSGRGKQGWYKGYWCDSSWELAYVIYNLEHDIKFDRNKEGFEYEFENKKYKYYPDFILEDGTYVEIKGYLDKKNNAKINSFNKKLIVIDKKGIQEYINYVVEKYGKNYIELYGTFV